MSNIILHLQPTSCVIARLYVVDCTSAGGVCNLDMIAKSQVAHAGPGVAIPLDTNLAAPKSHPVSPHIVGYPLSLPATHFDKFQNIIVFVGIYLSLQLRKKSVGYPSLKELLRPVVPLDTSILTPSDSKL